MNLKDDPEARQLVTDKSIELMQFTKASKGDTLFGVFLPLVNVLAFRALKCGMSKETLLSLVSDTYEMGIDKVAREMEKPKLRIVKDEE